MEAADNQGMVAVYGTKDDTWVTATATDEAKERCVPSLPPKSDQWRELGVSLLHRLVIDSLLGCEGHPKPTYVHEVSEVIEGVRGEGSQAESDSDEPYTLAALVMPAKLEHVEAISLHKERMPAKSTYFYPKLLSGLTFNPFALRPSLRGSSGQREQAFTEKNLAFHQIRAMKAARCFV